MSNSQPALVELLSGKTPEAIYDALYAHRYLAAKALRDPAEIVTFIKGFLRSSRQRALMPPNKIERLIKALAGSDFLNAEGKKRCEAAEPKARAADEDYA